MLSEPSPCLVLAPNGTRRLMSRAHFGTRLSVFLVLVAAWPSAAFAADGAGDGRPLFTVALDTTPESRIERCPYRIATFGGLQRQTRDRSRERVVAFLSRNREHCIACFVKIGAPLSLKIVDCFGEACGGQALAEIGHANSHQANDRESRCGHER